MEYFYSVGKLNILLGRLKITAGQHRISSAWLEFDKLYSVLPTLLVHMYYEKNVNLKGFFLFWCAEHRGHQNIHLQTCPWGTPGTWWAWQMQYLCAAPTLPDTPDIGQPSPVRSSLFFPNKFFWCPVISKTIQQVLQWNVGVHKRRPLVCKGIFNVFPQ